MKKIIVKSGFSLIEMIVVAIIAGILISLFIKASTQQIEEGKRYAALSFMDKVVSKACPAYISSFEENNDISNNNEINNNHNFDIDNLLSKYNLHIANDIKKYIKNYSLEYKNYNCILKFTMPNTKNFPLVSTSSQVIAKKNGNGYNFILYYPILRDGQILYYNVRTYKNYKDGKYPPGTFADYWTDQNGQSLTNIGSLIQYNASPVNFNRISSNNLNDYEYNSLSYSGHPIPPDMKIIH